MGRVWMIAEEDAVEMLEASHGGADPLKLAMAWREGADRQTMIKEAP